MMHEITTGSGSGGENTDNDTSEHLANEIELTDYAHELAFLPDLTEASETVLDYSGPNVLNPSATARQQEGVVAVLKRHEKIMIASGNALPPPAYGVVCDIDVQGHPPIKQRARRTPLRHLRKLYELLKGLLKARLVAFSDSPWASPIVIMLKQNGVDIRLCIDYKLVNAVTAIMEYVMPLVDDLLTDLEAYLWFCSLDAASGFWAIMMTMRARKVSAFVCALGHFEWLRMPFGLKNAPMIYQRMLDNALWGFVQPKGGWLPFSELMRTTEAHAEVARTGVTDPSLRPPEDSTTPPTKFEADRESSLTLDAVTQLVNSPVADMFSTGEPDESSLVPVFDRRSFVDDICFGSETFDACLETLDRLLQRFTECRISVSFTKSIFVQPKVDFLSHEVSAEGIRADTKKMKVVTELPFPASKKGMQSFLGALNYYSRFIQDFAVYGAALYQLKDEDFTPSDSLSAAKRSFAALQQKVAEAPILRHFDRDKEVHVTLFANEWALSSTLVQYHDDTLHPVRFCGRVLKDAEMNYHPAEWEVLALLLVLKVCYSQLVGRTIHVYTRFSTLEWVHKSKTLFGRATHFAVMLSPWHLVVNRVKERDCTFAQLLQAGLTSFVELEDSLAPVTPPTKGSPTARMDPHLLYACLPRSYTGFVMSFDGSAKTEKNGGYGSCSWILWKLPEWTVVTAASAYLETTTVNLAEYAGMNNGISAALEHGAEDLVIVGDSRLAIQQSLGVMACRKESLMVQQNRHRELTTKLRSVKYLHVVREFNAAADSAGEALSSKESSVASTETRKSELVELNRIGEVIYEPSVQTTAEEKPAVTFARVQVAHGISHDKSFFDFVRDGPDYLTATTRHQAKARKKRVQFADEISVIGPNDAAERDEANGVTTEAQNELRAEQSNNEADSSVPNAEDVDPVVIQEERRRRISAAQDEELRWSNLKAVLRGKETDLSYRAARDAWKMADKFVLSEDGVLYFLGANRRWGNERREETTMRLVVPTTMIQEVLRSCHDSLEGGHQGFVMGKAMSDTTALKVAQAFEECVYRRFGAPTLTRHDRDLRFMSEVFQAFAEMMQSRSRATLSYRPQANGQQERSVKTVMQSVRVYAEDPLQQDWDEIAQRLIFAINNSQDGTRKDTPFYLVHGWDAQSTLRAMSSSLKRGFGGQTDALAWRREVNRQQEISWKMAMEYQSVEKARRVREHNESLERRGDGGNI
uniref:Integrase catalytic domain-containing protein n=1 Tax=Phytophthora ramorum TaxID=164328 RepID=H3H680_PHYRM